MKSAIAASVLILASTSGAWAQIAPAVAQVPVQAAAPLNLSLAPGGFTLTDAQAEALRAGVAHTALDHRFIDRLTGSVGYLCGLHGPDYDEMAAMRGSDSQGKFLGAKLSLAFK